MLEKMKDFFEARLDGYDEHMLGDIEGAREFYPFTAKCMPANVRCKVLDLGAGTGLELEDYYLLCPWASVTAIDLSESMLESLKEKFTDKKIEVIAGNYFDVQLGTDKFNAAVSVESLHHFTKQEKQDLYKKVCKALKSSGYFIITDYFALSDKEEQEHFMELAKLKEQQGIVDGELYHFDTPLTVEHETEALVGAGFAKVEVLHTWGATATIKASK